jgi:hypothetical protein
MRRSLVSLAIAALLVLGLVVPAAAAPLEREHYTNSDSWTEVLCGTTWNAVGTWEGLFMLKAGRQGDPTPYVLDNYRFSITFTDASDPSRSFVISGRAMWKDLHITHLSGTLYEFEARQVGQPVTYRTSDGRVVVRDRGTLVNRFLIDTKGDADLSNDVFISGSPLIVRGPHPELDSSQAQRCAWIAEAVGG